MSAITNARGRSFILRSSLWHLEDRQFYIHWRGEVPVATLSTGDGFLWQLHHHATDGSVINVWEGPNRDSLIIKAQVAGVVTRIKE